MAPKAPYIIAAEQISGYEQYWNRANDPYLPYLPYKPISVGSTSCPRRSGRRRSPRSRRLSWRGNRPQQDMQAVLGHV